MPLTKRLIAELIGTLWLDLISIPVTNTSVNPARSTGPALIVGGEAIAQLWLFWVAPVIGAIIAGVAYPAVVGRGSRTAESELPTHSAT